MERCLRSRRRSELASTIVAPVTAPDLLSSHSLCNQAITLKIPAVAVSVPTRFVSRYGFESHVDAERHECRNPVTAVPGGGDHGFYVAAEVRRSFVGNRLCASDSAFSG
jgi:hypothetical protein